MGEESINVAMGLITGAGDSRSYCMEAIDLAREGKFDEARKALDNAVKGMIATHEVQTDLIREEMTGEAHQVSLLMVHAQDHLNLAIIMRDIAEEMIRIYERLNKLEEK